MQAQTARINEFLAATREHLMTLQEVIPILGQCLSNSRATPEELTCELLQKIPLHLQEIEGHPILAVTFCGPSGAGKSSIFNLLTRLGVPAGGARRPTTHASLAAIPRKIADQIGLNEFFQGFDLVSLRSMEDLKSRDTETKRLFFASYDSSEITDSLWPCLIDIPDFNTTELTNWEKAEQMIKRADSIIFTVYHEAYRDMRTFEILTKILKIAGNVTWLLTKLDPANAATAAEEIRNDLIDCARSRPDFQTQRTDGQTLAEFLADSAFYYSPYSTSPSLSEIKPLSNANRDFTSHIFGQKGLEIALKRQLQSIKAGVASCESICSEARETVQQLEREIQACETLMESAAKTITGEEFPVFRILELIRKQLEANRPSFLRRAFQPLLMLGSGIMKAISAAGSGIASLAGRDLHGARIQRDKLERQRLYDETSTLIEMWRRQPGLQVLTTEQCLAASEAILAAELPPIDSEWERTVNESLQQWQAGNKNLWQWLNIIDELFMLFGFGLVVTDFFIDGGVGTLGVVAVVGGSSAAGGFLMSLFNNLGLSREVIEAHENWKRLRRASFAKHLREKLAGPLFLNDLLCKNSSLAPDQIKRCENACQQLKEISRINEIR